MQSPAYVAHLVEDLDRLWEILNEGFTPNYHREDLSYESEDPFIVGIPMTSFTSLHLNELSGIMGEYGQYGLVMSMDWVLKAPDLREVSYLPESDLKPLVEAVREGRAKYDSIGHMKKTTSEWKGMPYDNTVEKEWRHTVSDSIVPWFKDESSYANWRGSAHRRPSPTEILKENTLLFQKSDVICIIVRDETDRQTLLKSPSPHLIPIDSIKIITSLELTSQL